MGEGVGQRRAGGERVERVRPGGGQRVVRGGVEVDGDSAIAAGQAGEAAAAEAIGAVAVVGIDVEGDRRRSAFGEARAIVVRHRRVVLEDAVLAAVRGGAGGLAVARNSVV